ncbi:MAG: SMP-30/gluconolactonase/LRE family protein [Rhodospirillaceae bacterium]|nr:SMP-30/gluconolactonase/LRE family protein [Rhodospirillaceae bacterium]
MYAAPPEINAQVFARIPEKFHIKGKKTHWAEIQLHTPESPCFLEGPSFDRENNLWVVDIPWGRLFKITPAGNVTCELEYDGWPNGLKFHKDGRAFITDAKNGVMVFDPKTGKVEPFLDKVLVQGFRGVNDLVFASNGDLYFTDQGQTGYHDPTGRLYRVRANGQVDLLVSNIPSPNGLVLNLTETIVYVAVTRDNAVWRVPMVKDTQVTKVGKFIQMSGGGGPDGMALDEGGGLVVCHVGLGSAWLFSNLGEPLLRIRGNVGPHVTNCAYGGKDNTQLFITTPDAVLVADMPTPGRKMYSHH